MSGDQYLADSVTWGRHRMIIVSDSTIPFVLDPYRFISRTAHRQDTDVFTTRLMLRPTTCLTGAQASRFFYDEEVFARNGAMPTRIQGSLLGRGGVQSLDDHGHRSRKRMFMSLLTGPGTAELLETVERRWLEAVERDWRRRDVVGLYEGMQRLLTRAVCEWAGVPLSEDEEGLRRRQLTALFDGAGAVGPRHWHARWSRRRANRWMEGLVEDHRSGRLPPEPGSVLETIASHRDDHGDLLAPRVAAVELLNVLRPTVAVSVYMVFLAHALELHRDWRDRLSGDVGPRRRWFVDEVRRFYPFFPAVAAVARREADWRGHRIPAGRRVMLDLYGINHDPGVWGDPGVFRPDRFAERDVSEHDLVPQGGGDHHTGHRCAGECVVIALMELGVEMFSRRLRYRVPSQDLDIDYGRMPALPGDRMLLSELGLQDGS